MGRSIMKRVTDAPKDGLRVAVNLGRSVRALSVALPHAGRVLPDLLRDLNRVADNLAHLTSDRGELTLLLRELTRFLRVTADASAAR
jgi:hypothetical protein